MIFFDTTDDDRVRTLAVEGEVDLDTAPKLRSAVLGALEDGVARVRVDLSGVTFLNSSGISALLAGLKQAQSRGIGFTVVRPQPQVRRVIDLVGLTDILTTES